MKNRTIHTIIFLFGTGLITSCSTAKVKSAQGKYCGYEMSVDEINEISAWYKENPNSYDLKNGSEIYSEINDTLRDNAPDSIVFELFLIKLTEDEVVIDAYVPNDKIFVENIACVFMKTNFSEVVPPQKKIRIYSYTNPDGSGDSPFEAGIKRNQ